VCVCVCVCVCRTTEDADKCRGVDLYGPRIMGLGQ